MRASSRGYANWANAIKENSLRATWPLPRLSFVSFIYFHLHIERIRETFFADKPHAARRLATNSVHRMVFSVVLTWAKEKARSYVPCFLIIIHLRSDRSLKNGKAGLPVYERVRYRFLSMS